MGKLEETAGKGKDQLIAAVRSQAHLRSRHNKAIIGDLRAHREGKAPWLHPVHRERPRHYPVEDGERYRTCCQHDPGPLIEISDPAASPIHYNDEMENESYKEEEQLYTKKDNNTANEQRVARLHKGELLNLVMKHRRKQLSCTNYKAVGSLMKNGGAGMAKRAWICKLCTG